MTDGPPILAQPTCPQCGAPVILPEYADVAVCSYCGSTLQRDGVRVAEGELKQGAQRQQLRSLRCSQCAGPLNAYEGKRILVCEHCGVRVAVLEHGGVTHWYFPARVDSARALAAGASWLRDYPGIAGLARTAEPSEIKLAYVPIWEHRVLAAGWEFGSQHRSRMAFVKNQMTGEADQAMELQLNRENVQEPHLQERRMYLPATDFEVLDAGRPRITGRELLVPLVAGELDESVLVLQADGEASTVVERGREAAQMPLAGLADPDAHIFLFRESVALLYYPLWLLRFRHADVHCRVVVDGRDGSVNSGQAPADQRRRQALLVGKILALLAAVAVLIYFAVTRASLRPSLLALAVILSVAAVVLGVRFQPEKEVHYHDSFSC